MTRTPLCPEHLVEGAGELGVPVVDQEPAIVESTVHGEVPGLLGHPSRIRVGGHPSHVHPPGAELDEEQDVHRLQPDRLHGEEVTGQNASCLDRKSTRLNSSTSQSSKA